MLFLICSLFILIPYISRRDMGDNNLDPVLFSLVRDLFREMQIHYEGRMGLLYVLGMNDIFLTLFNYILKPFLIGIGRPVVKIVNSTEGKLLHLFKEICLF